MGRALGVVLGLLLGLSACGQQEASMSKADSAVAEAREKRLAQLVAAQPSDSASDKPVAKWILPPELAEISGLALTADGRLLAHGDEHGRVWVIDPRRGIVLKRFSIGEKTVEGDFEGITDADGTLYLLTSKGDLYAFKEGADHAHVPYVKYDTGLGHECEFEGVAYDRANASLLLACKNVAKKGLRDHLVIYRWKLQQTDASRLTMLTVPLDRVTGGEGKTKLHPSDITVDPSSGNYVLVAAQEHMLVEITSAGDLVRVHPLQGEHPQAEGVAITKDSLLIVSDEATNRTAVITVYRWTPPAATIGAAP
jgi:uncharacterized protein YjiK